MRITRQSIKWLGNNRVQISTTRSKHKNGTYVRVGWLGVSTPPRHRSNKVTDVIGMDPERFKIERKRIQRGLFRSYDPEKYYQYNEDAAYFPEDQFKEGLQRFANLFRTENSTDSDAADQSVSSTSDLSPLPETMWWKVTIVGTLFSFIPFFTPEGTIGAVAAAVFFFSWVFLPIGLYEDAQITAKASDGWSPHKWIYAIAAIVPVLSTFVGMLYLMRRWNHNRIAVSDASTDNSNDEDALTTLRQRYAQGEINLGEFEDSVNSILETEPVE